MKMENFNFDDETDIERYVTDLKNKEINSLVEETNSRFKNECEALKKSFSMMKSVKDFLKENKEEFKKCVLKYFKYVDDEDYVGEEMLENSENRCVFSFETRYGDFVKYFFEISKDELEKLFTRYEDEEYCLNFIAKCRTRIKVEQEHECFKPYVTYLIADIKYDARFDVFFPSLLKEVFNNSTLKKEGRGRGYHSFYFNVDNVFVKVRLVLKITAGTFECKHLYDPAELEFVIQVAPILNLNKIVSI